MLKSISFKKLAVLSAGIVIVLSSCGLQNTASESSGDATAAGKTKNFTLVNGQACFETKSQYVNEWSDANNIWNNNYNIWFANDGFPSAQGIEVVGGSGVWIGINWQPDPTGLANAYWAPYSSPTFGDCEEQIALLGEDVVAGIPNVATGSISVKVCVKPEVKQSIIDGYTEQLARPVGGEVTEAYLAAMQKGLDVANGMCTN
jgi:hypothetical protein